MYVHNNSWINILQHLTFEIYRRKCSFVRYQETFLLLCSAQQMSSLFFLSATYYTFREARVGALVLAFKFGIMFLFFKCSDILQDSTSHGVL